MVEVKAIFDNILPFDFDRLSLNVVNTDDLVNVTETIPADLVGLARFKRLDITSYRRLVEVDSNAFRSSSNTLIELYLWDLDMSPPFSFSFIEGFDQLKKIKIPIQYQCGSHFYHFTKLFIRPKRSDLLLFVWS